MCGHFQAREPRGPVGFHFELMAISRSRWNGQKTSSDGTADMNANRNSDESHSTNDSGEQRCDAEAPAESNEGRGYRQEKRRASCLVPDSGPDRSASQVACTACVKLPVRTARSNLLHCCTISTKTAWSEAFFNSEEIRPLLALMELVGRNMSKT